VWRQTYGYLPSLGASPLFDRYQIILLGDRGTCVWTTCLRSLTGSVLAQNWTRAPEWPQDYKSGTLPLDYRATLLHDSSLYKILDSCCYNFKKEKLMSCLTYILSLAFDRKKITENMLFSFVISTLLSVEHIYCSWTRAWIWARPRPGTWLNISYPWANSLVGQRAERGGIGGTTRSRPHRCSSRLWDKEADWSSECFVIWRGTSVLDLQGIRGYIVHTGIYITCVR